MFKGKFCILAILFATAGCTVVHTNRFRVVDAVSGQPIPGVRAEGKGKFPVALFTVHEFGPYHATSDDEGLIKFEALGTDEVSFEAEGYESVEVVSDWPGYRHRNWFRRLRAFPWEDESTPLIALEPRERK